MKREVERGSHSEFDCASLPVSTAGCPDSVFVTLFRRAADRARCGGHGLLGTEWRGPHRLNVYCPGGGWRSLPSLRVGALGTSC